MFGFNEAMLSLTQNMYLEFLENTSVVSPIFRRTGDRSDGDFNPASNTTLTKNTYQFNEVNIPAGVTVTAKAPGLLMIAKKVIISGLLTASGLGANGGLSGAEPANAGESGAGHVGGGGGAGGGMTGTTTGKTGGNGGSGRTSGGLGVKGIGPDGNSDIDAFFNLATSLGGLVGGGGGAGVNLYGGKGGNGGGYIYIVCNEIILSSGGAIRAEGINGDNGGQNGSGGGGGGGGAIIIDCLKCTIAGTISVAGGSGGKGYAGYYAGGNGGNGYLRIIRRGL